MMEKLLMVLTAIVIIAVVAMPIGCQANRDRLRADVIGKAADPIAASCAFDSTDAKGESKAMCTLKASQK